MLKEIKLKYSTQRFFDLRNKYLNTNSMEVELTTHTYIDNFHLFLEIRKDVESILDLLYQADQFYLEIIQVLSKINFTTTNQKSCFEINLKARSCEMVINKDLLYFLIGMYSN